MQRRCDMSAGCVAVAIKRSETLFDGRLKKCGARENVRAETSETNRCVRGRDSAPVVSRQVSGFSISGRDASTSVPRRSFKAPAHGDYVD